MSKKKKSKKFKSRLKNDKAENQKKLDLNEQKLNQESSESKEVAKEVLREKEAEIEKERLGLIALNKSEEKNQVKESIQEKEEKLRKLLLERRELKKQLAKEKVELKDVVVEKRKIEKIEEKSTEPEYYEYIEEDKNVVKVFFDAIRYYSAKYIFRKNIERLEYVREARHDFNFKILFSVVLTLLTITVLVLFMKYFSTTKDSYGDYLANNTTTTTTQSSISSTSAESNNNSSQENTNSSLIELANKEETEANTAYNPGITLSVVREIKVLEKLNTYQTAGWESKSDSVEKDTTLKVNAVSFPGGYMMYQIAEGQLAGKYITANPKLVEITANNDSMNFDFITYPLAVSTTAEQDVFEDKELTKAKSKAEQNKTYNVKGYGVANNRLVYHLEDGTYLPFSNNVMQVQRTA